MFAGKHIYTEDLCSNIALAKWGSDQLDALLIDLDGVLAPHSVSARVVHVTIQARCDPLHALAAVAD